MVSGHIGHHYFKLIFYTELTTDFGLPVSSTSKHLFQHNIREVYIDKLVSNLEERFADSDLLGSLVLLFHPSKASESLQDSFSKYGDTAVTTVAAKFTTTVDKERLQLQLMGFKHTYAK